MPGPSSASNAAAIDAAWLIVLAASRAASRADIDDRAAAFALDEGGELIRVDDGAPHAVVSWRPGIGWDNRLASNDPRHALLDLYLPIASATPARPVTVGHLGQSLDGFIATHEGESQFVTGEENILHLHRMRALCDAVIVGAGTVAADDPLLTTRKVSGPHPIRVVLDPARRLDPDFKVFTDERTDTLYMTTDEQVRAGETHVGLAPIVTIPKAEKGVDCAAVLRALRERGCYRVFVEGGGVTVSMFLEANLLDRLQVAIAPLIIGNGRPAIRLPARASLADCARPRYRVFRMGGDVFFDCALHGSGQGPDDGDTDLPLVTRVI